MSLRRWKAGKCLQTFGMHYQTWATNKDWKVLPSLVHDVIFMHDRHFLTPNIPKKSKPMNWIMEMNFVNLENVFKVAYYWSSMMVQCFCQHVNTDGICQLSYRFCQTKHRTISGHWVCHCQVNTYEQFSLNISREQAAFGYGKMYFVHNWIPT